MSNSAEPIQGQKGDLRDLTKIPAQDFECHFQNWMQQDDVARSLQAKLRRDLVMAFNQTALGKQMHAQTTTTIGGSGLSARLTLSPLVLALNTLVAEFLYAQNCHFSLSVFCTEVPYCNTLPDFESMRHFRFDHNEVTAILEAIFPTTANADKSFALQISKEYTKSTNASLLLLILKSLVHRMIPKMVTSSATARSGTSTPKRQSSQNAANPQNGQNTKTSPSMQPDEAPDGGVGNEQLRQLNRYLLMLTKKVGTMIDVLENSKSAKDSASYTSLRPRLLLSARTRKYENLNRSLERVTRNLKQITHTKKQDKNISAIVKAINTLSQQFAKCSAKLEPTKQAQEVGAAAPTQVNQPQQKPYAQWVHDLRHTENGQKFLERVENSMKKIFNKQKEQLRTDMEMKLKLHKELLKVHFRQRLSEELSKMCIQPSNKGVSEVQPCEPPDLHLEKVDEMIAHIEPTLKSQILTQTQSQRCSSGEIFMSARASQSYNIQTVNKESRELAEGRKSADETRSLSKDIATNTSNNYTNVAIQAGQPQRAAPTSERGVNTQKELSKLLQSMNSQCHREDNIVSDAKLRIEELDAESNRVDQNFRNFLERRRMRKELTNEAAIRLWQTYIKERDELRNKYRLDTPTTSRIVPIKRVQIAIDQPQVRDEHAIWGCADVSKECSPVEMPKLMTSTATQSDEGMEAEPHTEPCAEPEFRNAIIEAKEKLFTDLAEARLSKEKLFKPMPIEEVLPPAGAEGDGNFHMGAYFINNKFMQFESQANIFLAECAENNKSSKNIDTSRWQQNTSPKKTTVANSSNGTRANRMTYTSKLPVGRSLRKPLHQLPALNPDQESNERSHQSNDSGAKRDANAKTIYRNINYNESTADVKSRKSSGGAPMTKGVKAKAQSIDLRWIEPEARKSSGDCPAVDIGQLMQPPSGSTVEDSLAKMRRLFSERVTYWSKESMNKPPSKEEQFEAVAAQSSSNDRLNPTESRTSGIDTSSKVQPHTSTTTSYHSATDEEFALRFEPAEAMPGKSAESADGAALHSEAGGKETAPCDGETKTNETNAQDSVHENEAGPAETVNSPSVDRPKPEKMPPIVAQRLSNIFRSIAASMSSSPSSTSESRSGSKFVAHISTGNRSESSSNSNSGSEGWR